MSFCPFSRLPYELRSYIWSLAVEPRRITNVRAEMIKDGLTTEQRRRCENILYEAASVAVPALMHVCYESRKLAPYRQAFTVGIMPRWTWVNFDLDIFCVSSLYDIEKIRSHRSEVQRLEIRTDRDVDWYESATIYNTLKILYEFPSLREIRIVLEPGDLMWEDVFSEWDPFGLCPRENITFLDEGSGLVLTGSQLGVVVAWRQFFSFDSPDNPPEPDRLQEATEWAHDSYHTTMAQMYEVG